MHRLTGLLVGLLLVAALSVPVFATGSEAEFGSLRALHAVGHGSPPDCCDHTPTDGNACFWACLSACTVALWPAGPSVTPAFDVAVPTCDPAAAPAGHGPPTATPPPKRAV